MELLYKSTQRKAGAGALEPDVDAAFNQPRILAKLGVLGSERLIEQVAGIDDRLNPAWEHAESRQILRD